ncbi:hypothetical protein GCM10017771_52860 [Streptomyces capitiformicae]|uniref:Uncharacterized protein n=1 Tax=Streptomyces capitiformicae TaxID=2014920 RepID=A0A918Z5H7_9ACTN|nr:hypothetical protein GCM10017771_52860 [Streptomyces capitiformicae]
MTTPAAAPATKALRETRPDVRGKGRGVCMVGHPFDSGAWERSRHDSLSKVTAPHASVNPSRRHPRLLPQDAGGSRVPSP